MDSGCPDLGKTSSLVGKAIQWVFACNSRQRSDPGEGGSGGKAGKMSRNV